jgi:hypothetical protein
MEQLDLGVPSFAFFVKNNYSLDHSCTETSARAQELLQGDFGPGVQHTVPCMFRFGVCEG